jgi:hypothetical protein
LGVAPVGPVAPTPIDDTPPARAAGASRWWLAALAGLLVLGAAWSLLGTRAPTSQSSAGQIGGRWAAQLSRGERVKLVITQSGERVTLASEPIPIAARSDWADYRAFWRERTGSELNAVMYRGEGRLIADPGVAPRIDIALTVHASPGNGEPVDGGNLSAVLAPDGRTLSGTIWLNSLQSEQPASLTREP